jgi:hypothetical protein
MFGRNSDGGWRGVTLPRPLSAPFQPWQWFWWCTRCTLIHASLCPSRYPLNVEPCGRALQLQGVSSCLHMFTSVCLSGGFLYGWLGYSMLAGQHASRGCEGPAHCCPSCAGGSWAQLPSSRRLPAHQEVGGAHLHARPGCQAQQHLQLIS